MENQKETGVQSALEAKVYQLEQEKRQLEEERNHEKNLRSNIEGEKKLLRVRIDGLKDKVQYLQSKMDPSQEYLKGLKQKLGVAEFNYSKVLQECVHLKEENRKLKIAFEELKGQQQLDIQQLEREEAEFQRRAESLEEEKEDYSKVLKECQHLKEEIRILNIAFEELKGQQQNIQQLEREKAEFQRRAESLEEELKLIKEQKPNQGLRNRLNRKPAHDQKASKNSQYSSNSKRE